MNPLKGLYQHLRTGGIYFVNGCARDVTNPNKISIVYSQLYESKLKNTDTNLPRGSMWIRDINDFENKFKKCPEN